jgi:hypothetical protein
MHPCRPLAKIAMAFPPLFVLTILSLCTRPFLFSVRGKETSRGALTPQLLVCMCAARTQDLFLDSVWNAFNAPCVHEMRQQGMAHKSFKLLGIAYLWLLDVPEHGFWIKETILSNPDPNLGAGPLSEI